MKITISLVLLIMMFCYASDIDVKFKPFKVSFGDLAFGLASLLLVISITLFSASAYNKGKSSGYKEALNNLREFVEQKDEDD